MKRSQVMKRIAALLVLLSVSLALGETETNHIHEVVQHTFEVPELIKFMGSIPSDTDATITMGNDKSVVEFNGRVSMSMEGKLNNWGPGARHTIKGRLELFGCIFESSTADPLVFRVVRDRGYVYERGTGTVTTPTGKKINLVPPEPVTKPMAPQTQQHLEKSGE